MPIDLITIGTFSNKAVCFCNLIFADCKLVTHINLGSSDCSSIDSAIDAMNIKITSMAIAILSFFVANFQCELANYCYSLHP